MVWLYSAGTHLSKGNLLILKVIHPVYALYEYIRSMLQSNQNLAVFELTLWCKSWLVDSEEDCILV